MKTKIVMLLTIPLLFTGCASILDGGPKTVQISSNPQGAKVTVFDKKGKEISANTTPTTLVLDRGGFYSAASYKLHFEMPGYYPYETEVNSSLDGWYFGNIIFGGFIGILIVDPATGDMWTLTPRQVNCNFVATDSALTPEEIKAAELRANPAPAIKPASTKGSGK